LVDGAKQECSFGVRCSRFDDLYFIAPFSHGFAYQQRDKRATHAKQGTDNQQPPKPFHTQTEDVYNDADGKHYEQVRQHKDAYTFQDSHLALL